jgi:voltage-gated potassium channel
MTPNVRRLLWAVAVVALVILVGGVAIFWLGHGRWAFGDGLYMAAISAATVGFSELPGFDQVRGARAVVVVIILLGIGAFAFFQSSLTAFFVEGMLGEAVRRRRMERNVASLRDHVVVAGCGSTGRHVVEELVETRRPFVVIDRDRSQLEALNADIAKGTLLYVVGDATHDATLLAAGVDRASGVIAALTHDRDNLYVALSARTLNAHARIVTKVVELEAVPKMLRAGANATVSPNMIGGRRLASELVRPTVVEFLDLMLRDKERNLRIEEVTVPAHSQLVGCLLSETDIRQRTNTLVMAVRAPGQPLRYNPDPDFAIQAETVLVVLGEVVHVQALRQLVQVVKRQAIGA